VFANTPLGGLTEEDLIGTSLFDWINTEQQAEVEVHLALVFSSGQSQEFELAGIPQHNPDAWYECRFTPNNREGRAASVTIVAHEITRHKHKQRELAQRIEELSGLLDERTADLAQARTALASGSDAEDLGTYRFRRLLDDAGEAIFITDRETGELTDLNETACRWLRRTRAGLIGQRSADLDLGYPILIPEDLELQLTETRDTRRPHLLDRGSHRRADGTTFPVEVAVAVHTWDEKEYILAVVRDIKNRKRLEDQLRETEAQYRQLFEQSWDAIYITARAGEVVDVNGAALDLFGYARHEFNDLNARELFVQGDHIRAFQREMSRAGMVEGLEVQFKTRDGHVFDALLSATRRRDRGGAIRGYQCIVRALSDPWPNDVQPSESQSGESQPSESRLVEAPVETNGRVLVIDNETAMLTDMRAALEQAGLRVTVASDAYQGLEIFRATPEAFGLTVVDTSSAEPESRRALEVMRSLSEHARFVLVGNDDPVDQAQRFGDLGVAGYLKKPLHPLGLIQKIRELGELQ
jgi:PAS domain S-box-containing protein